MKRNYILLLFFALLLAGGFVTSCYDDDSTLRINDVGNIEIDTTGINTLSVYQFDILNVTPEINISGLSESDLEYTWKINVSPNDTVFTTIGNEKNLSYEVRLAPNESEYYYILTLTITDKSHNLDYMMDWETTVKNNLGEGLVIATTDDDSYADLSIIMSPEVTEGYSKNRVLRDVYSANNGDDLIIGLVKQMRSTTVYGVNSLFAITDNSVIKVQTSDYTLAGTNDDLFFASKNSYAPQALGGIYQGDMYIGNHQLTGTYLGASKRWGLPFDFSYEVPDHVSFNPNTSDVLINFYDESLGGFVYIPTIQSYGDHDMHEYEPVSNDIFDPASVSNKENLAAQVNEDNDFLHLLKDKTTGDVSLYVLDGGGSEGTQVIAPEPKAMYDFSSAPDIDDAKYFVLLNNQKVMFYATSTKIYAALYGTTTPVFEERYTVSSGEEITTLQGYQQVVGLNEAPSLSTDNKMLVMSTYSDEGKVYLLPYKNLGSANIDTDNIKVFEGFDRITAIAPQQ